MNKFERVLSDPQLISLAVIGNLFLHGDSEGDFYIIETGENVDFDNVMALLRKVEQATVKAFKAQLAEQKPVATVRVNTSTGVEIEYHQFQGLYDGMNLYAHPSPPVKQEPIGYLHANELSYIDAKSGTKEELHAYDYTIPLYAAPVPQKHTEQPLEMVPEGFQIVPKEPTEEMHHAARDWSIEKYGKAIGFEASHGCYKAMLAAASKYKGSNDD